MGVMGAELSKRKVKVCALSCDSVENDAQWISDIEHATKGSVIDFPIIGDENREIAVQLGMLNNAHKSAAGIPLPARGVYIIGPDKKLKLQLLSVTIVPLPQPPVTHPYLPSPHPPPDTQRPPGAILTKSSVCWTRSS